MLPTLRRRPAIVAAGVVSATVLIVLAVPSVGLIGSSSGSAVVTAVTPEQLAASIEAANLEASAASSAPSEPAEHGPYPVATTTVTLVDPIRATPARGSTPASSSRTLTVTIYYPVTDTTAQFPLVVFVHGYDVSAATYKDLEQEVAEAGFIVAAPDFPLSSSALDGEAERDAVEQASDVSFVITSLLDASTRPVELTGLIADTKVGVIGHSDGGITTAGVAFNDEFADSRVGAAVTLSGAEASFPGSWFDGESPALLAIHGTADEINPFAASQTLFDDATGPKWLVRVTGGSHLGPFTTDPVRTQVSALVAGFLHAELEGDAAARDSIDSLANAQGLTLVAQG
jgi:dienelactone hydrolase